MITIIYFTQQKSSHTLQLHTPIRHQTQSDYNLMQRINQKH